jgi:hypothetical protein
MSVPSVQILSRQQIDDTKWDQAVRQATNSLPYAYTWYLDSLCPSWIALVAGDYEYIMPLPVASKWGIKYVYQPLFCQQLGVFYHVRNEAVILEMLRIALRRYIFVNINLNYDNLLKPTPKAVSAKKNLIIRLDEPHSQIAQRYHENAQRNIKKALKAGLTFEQVGRVETDILVDLYLANTVKKDASFKEKNLMPLKRLVESLATHDSSRMFVARTKDRNICATVILVETDRRIIHLLPAADGQARQYGGMHFLIDSILAHYSGSQKIYDFEGSSVESIARFYDGFGAIEEPFFMAHRSIF